MATVKEWFPHDYHASRDIRLMRLLRAGGTNWYGMYWLCVEVLHAMENVHLDDLRDALCVVGRATDNDIDAFFAFATEQALFVVVDKTVSSQRIERNLAMRKQITEAKRHAATKRWSQPMHEQCTSNADAMLMQCQNITEQNITKQTTLRTDAGASKARPQDGEQVAVYFAELQMPRTEAQRFVDYYTANGWKVGRNPMRDWKAAARNWKKGYEDKKHPGGVAPVAPVSKGLPQAVQELASRPRIPDAELQSIRQVYLTKINPTPEDLTVTRQATYTNTETTD